MKNLRPGFDETGHWTPGRYVEEKPISDAQRSSFARCGIIEGAFSDLNPDQKAQLLEYCKHLDSIGCGEDPMAKYMVIDVKTGGLLINSIEMDHEIIGRKMAERPDGHFLATEVDYLKHLGLRMVYVVSL